MLLMTIEKIKKFLKADSYFQLIIVLIVFSITGSLSLFLSDYLLKILDINKNNYDPIFFYLLRVFFIFPIYQILLIFIGTIFGEFNYFWEFEKKFLRRLGIRLK
jgi:hypothetical protein